MPVKTKKKEDHVKVLLSGRSPLRVPEFETRTNEKGVEVVKKVAEVHLMPGIPQEILSSQWRRLLDNKGVRHEWIDKGLLKMVT